MSMNTPARRMPPLKPVKTYTRPMKGWYNRNPFYAWYMLREATCVAVGYFALLVICAVERLGAGEAAFEHFMMTMRSPLWLVINALAFVAFVYHAVTWFAVMPKTMPFIFVGGKSLPDETIITGGATAGVLGALAVLAAFWMSAP